MENSPKPQVLLFFTTNPEKVKKRILRFRKAFIQLGENFDFSIVSFMPLEKTSISTKIFNGIKIAHYVYGPDAITTLKYPIKGNRKPFKLIPGNTDLVTLLFWRSHGQYERFWLMEDDVEYSGDPYALFSKLKEKNGDLLATHVARGFSDWAYSANFRSPDQNISVAESWLAFLPFFRINNASLKLIDQCYMNGWDGHSEMAWATILKTNGCSVIDIGGNGEYVSGDDRNKYYIGSPGTLYEKRGSFGTMDIRLCAGKEENLLWHPIKLFRPWLRQNVKRFISVIQWYWTEFFSRFFRKN